MTDFQRPLSEVVLTPGETLSPGDWVTIDRTTGKLRKAVPGVDERGFTLPASARINTSTGCVEWDQGEPIVPVDATLVWASIDVETHKATPHWQAPQQKEGKAP